MSLAVRTEGYAAWLGDLKARIRATRLRTALQVNTELVSSYWQIGRDLLERQSTNEWVSRIVEQIARDLRAEFPDSRLLLREPPLYAGFADAWPDQQIVQQVVGRLPWGQNIELFGVKDPKARLWYAEAPVDRGWSRALLGVQIDSRLFSSSSVKRNAWRQASIRAFAAR